MSMIDKINQWRGKDRRRHEVVHVAVTHELSDSAHDLIQQLIASVNGAGGSDVKLDQILQTLLPIADMPFVKQELGIVHELLANNSEAINNLIGKVDTMSSNIDRIEKEAADMAENVGLVRTAVEDLRAASDAMKAEIADLKAQVAQGQLDQARLDAAAAVFEKADDDLDAVVLPPAPPTDTPPEG